ncbi:Exopolygalacturonase [Sesamum angolense]|uniref:Exopolygalacturonase n=2 Tax=Sesamum TaxID=4181 RepID=A0AAE1X5I1_9LAMI|nr:Exopolygalacturonase [Sesamum angolense]
MAHQENLVKIAQEGFALVEEFYSRSRRPERLPHENPVQKTYPVWRSFATPKTIDTYQAAKKYGGIVVLDGRRKYRTDSTVLVLILCSALVSCHAAGGRAGRAAVTTFNVLSYGAKPGKQQESTQAFFKAWKAACDFDREAMILIPPGVYKLGETIFQGPCKSRTPITILLQGTLQAVSDISAYPDKGWISFDEVNGLILTGGGTIDGKGQDVWKYDDCKTNPNCVHLAASIYMTKVKNAKVKSINLINSMGFHMHITNSYLVRFHSLKVTSEDGPNTDGMHISKSNTVKVSRSVFRTGDDCISIGQGSNNVTINQVTCGPGHGISVGSLGKVQNELDVQGLIVKNCTLVGTTNGLRIKTFPASGPSKASGLLFKDIIMEKVKNPIIIDQNYGSKSTKPSRVKISDVFYQNIRGTTISPVAVNLKCSAQEPCKNIRFHNINLRHTSNVRVSSTCTNAVVQRTGLQSPQAC